jgi:hypothetical protein
MFRRSVASDLVRTSSFRSPNEQSFCMTCISPVLDTPRTAASSAMSAVLFRDEDISGTVADGLSDDIFSTAAIAIQAATQKQILIVVYVTR